MDVNGTRYHLMNGATDWLPMVVADGADSLWWDEEQSSLLLKPEVLRLPPTSDSDLLQASDRRGASFDHYGNVYWIDADSSAILYRPAATPIEVGTFWSVDDLTRVCEPEQADGIFQPCIEEAPPPQPTLRGMAVTAHEYLVVGTLAPAGLLIFDLHQGGPPEWFEWPEAVDFDPFDIAPAPDGGIWVLDRGPALGQARYWRLDRFFRIVRPHGTNVQLEPESVDDFRPVDGQSRVQREILFPSGVAIDMSSPIMASDPVAIEGLPDGSVVVLDANRAGITSVLHFFLCNGLARRVVVDENILGTILDPPSVLGHDISFVPSDPQSSDSVNGTLYIASARGQQAFEFALALNAGSISLALLPSLLPMRDYSGKSLICTQGDVYYDFDSRWLPLTDQPRRRYVNDAEIDGLIFDGTEPDCVWHRLLLDACIPDGASVVVAARTANEKDELRDAEWQRQPMLLRRPDGSELPFHEPFSERESESPGVGTWELLLQNAFGRYIELQLTLIGTGRSTPRIRAMRVYYPRFSYRDRFLPAVYRDERATGNFLDRFLANAEGVMTTLETKMAHAEAIFDTRSSPYEYLEWLAGWFGANLDASWDESRRRLFLDNAELLFRWRGTQIGMRAAIRLAIEPCPDARIFDELHDQRVYQLGTLGGNVVRIVERFLSRTQPGITLGDTTAPTQLFRESTDEKWQPEQGPDPLHLEFRRFLEQIYEATTTERALALQDVWSSDIDAVTFSPTVPDDESQAVDWRRFTREGLAFTYAAITSEDAPQFREFLARRYGSVDELNSTYGLDETNEYASFDDVELPPVLPESRVVLTDWIEFVSLAVPIRRDAHRFTVLVPTLLGETPGSREQRKLQAEEIVRREKPAHTDFDVKLYWALFQIGTARLGLDTTLGEGTRFVALVLGANYLGQTFLTESHPWSVRDRLVIGRDRLGASLSRSNGT